MDPLLRDLGLIRSSATGELHPRLSTVGTTLALNNHLENVATPFL